MKRAGVLAGLVLAIGAVGCGPSKQTAFVTFKTDTTPPTKLSEQYMKVAVYDATVEGDTQEFDQKKWSKMTADMLRYYLQEANEKDHMPFEVVDRQHMDKSMGEKDLGSAGITNTSEDINTAKMEDVGSVLTSDITIKIDKQAGKQRTVSAMDVFAHGGWGGGGGGGGVNTEEVEKEARNITVVCQFQLKDPGSNKIVVGHSTLPQNVHDRTSTSGFFGSSKTEADMTPRDEVISQMITKHMMDFLAKFVPTHQQYEIEVKSSGHEKSISGVKKILAEDYDGALKDFKACLAEKPEDDVTLFAAGVVCEKLKDLDQAKKYYRMALSLEPAEAKYKNAVDRVTAAANA